MRKNVYTILSKRNLFTHEYNNDNIFSFTTAKLPKILTSSLIKSNLMPFGIMITVSKVKKRLYWSIKKSGEVLGKLSSRGFRATTLQTYDFSILYTTLLHK